MSLKKIADRTGVSVSTVSRALSGQARISEEVRRRVIDAARETGYLDGRIRRAVHPGLSSLAIVAPSDLLAPSDTNFVTWTIFEGLRDACAQRGVRTLPIVSPGEALDPDVILPRLAETKADAIAVIFDDNPRVVSAVARLERPVVLLAGQDPSMRIPSVGIGNRYGSRLGTDYLLRKGHRRIALVTWGGRYTIRQREDGFREVMEEHGLGRDAQQVIRLTSFEPEVAEAQLSDAIARSTFERTTALFCLADNIALGAIRACQAAGLDVPGDISILGFDDTVAGELTNPPLTTIHAPLRSIGRAALDELELQARAVEGERVVRRVELSCQLVERASCGPPP